MAGSFSPSPPASAAARPGGEPRERGARRGVGAVAADATGGEAHGRWKLASSTVAFSGLAASQAPASSLASRARHRMIRMHHLSWVEDGATCFEVNNAEGYVWRVVNFETRGTG